jgi:hypothetical protein
MVGCQELRKSVKEIFWKRDSFSLKHTPFKQHQFYLQSNKITGLVSENVADFCGKEHHLSLFFSLLLFGVALNPVAFSCQGEALPFIPNSAIVKWQASTC